LRAVPRQSLRARSKWESAPGPSDAALPDAAADVRKCEAIGNTIARRRARRTRTKGTVVRQRMREKVGIAIQRFSFELIEAPEEPAE